MAVALIAGVSAAQTAPPAGARQIRMELSPAGEATVKKFLGAPDPATAPLAQRFRDVAAQIVALADAPKLDLARLTVLLRKQEQTQAAIVRRSNDRMLAMITALSEADRVKFLRGLKSARPGSAPGR